MRTPAAPALQVVAFAFAALVIAAPLSLRAADGKAAAKAPKVTFEDDVKPIFRARCAGCHNTEKKTAGLDLTNFAGVMAGGGSGAVVEPGSSSDSYLFSLVSHTSQPYMPLKADKLPPELIETIQKWIDGGALEHSGSKAMASKKPKVDLSLKGASTGRPAGPPPMPEKLSLETLVHTGRTTAVRTLATSPWAPLAAVPGQKQVLLYNMQTLKLAGVLPFPEGIPYCLKFSPNGQLLLAGGGHSSLSGRAIVWNVKTGERVFEVGDELDAVLGADISADQSLIALGGPGKVVRVYSTADGSLKFQMKKHTDWIYSVAFSPDGVLLATGDRNGGVIVWEAKTGREFYVLGGHAAGVTALSWRIDSNILASASEDTTIKLWEMENGNQVKSWGAHGGGVTSVAFARDGRIVSCGRDGHARLWEQNGAAKVTYSGFSDLPLCVAYNDDTNRLIAADWTGTVRVFDGASGKQIGTLDDNPPKLAIRVDSALKQLPDKQAAHKKLADQLAAARAESQKRKADFDAAEKAVRTADDSVKTAMAAATKARSDVDHLAADVEAGFKRIVALDPVVPLLKEAAEKALQAAAKLPGDKEVAAAANTVQSQFQRSTKQLADTKQAVIATSARLEKTRADVTAADKQTAEAKAAAATARKQLADLKPLVKKADEQTAQAQKAFDASSQSLADDQQEIQRWQAEIASRNKTAAR